MRALPIVLFVLACGPSTTVIDGDNPDGGGDTDTGADTGDTDTGGDTGDTGGDTGDTGSDENPDAGDYAGEMSGVMGDDDWGQECQGELEFSIDQDGTLAGYATCEFGGGNGGWPVEGTLEGEVVDGDLTALWMVDLGWGEPYELTVSGNTRGGKASLEFYGDFGRMGEFVGEGDAKAR